MTMTRSTWTLAFLFCSLLTPQTRAAERNGRDPHIRSNDAELLNALASGGRVSPTLQRLVDRIETSDVVVYLTFDRVPSPKAAGHVSCVTAAAGRRYLRISIDRRNAGCQLAAILGHELQHVVEIADEPAVTTEAGLAALYRRIGFRSVGEQTDCFDSLEAITAGRLVQREVLMRYAEFTSR